MSAISLRAHWMTPMPMNSRAQAEGEVLGAEAADGVVLADREVRDDEQHRADRGQAEQGCNLALGPLLHLRVDVGGAPVVLRDTRVRVQVVARGEVLVHRLVVVAGRRGAHASTFFFVERVVWAAIQTAAPTQRPKPP
jgi:hypothetical protein